jgi:tRNA dimethylallyltransferase
MNKLLIISGPTATGKTDLAVKLAKLYNGELISADSRQIYQGLDIGTGKDHPKNIKINLIDLITPDQSFSVAQYRQLVIKKISEIQAKNKLPILVGCSGFYIDSVVNPNYNTFSVIPNFLLRKIFFKFPTPLLKFILKTIDRKTYSQLNNSDINNPLRLIRKIEIKLSKKNIIVPLHQGGIKGGFNILHLSLIAPTKFLYERIDARVEKRLKIGHIDELKNLLKKYSWSDPGLKVSAYSCFCDYFDKKISFDEAIQKWKYSEHRDARRQFTWFKKQKNLNFIDITELNFSTKVFDLVKKWYNLS